MAPKARFAKGSSSCHRRCGIENREQKSRHATQHNLYSQAGRNAGPMTLNCARRLLATHHTRQRQKPLADEPSAIRCTSAIRQPLNRKPVSHSSGPDPPCMCNIVSLRHHAWRSLHSSPGNAPFPTQCYPAGTMVLHSAASAVPRPRTGGCLDSPKEAIIEMEEGIDQGACWSWPGLGKMPRGELGGKGSMDPPWAAQSRAQMRRDSSAVTRRPCLERLIAPSCLQRFVESQAG